MRPLLAGVLVAGVLAGGCIDAKPSSPTAADLDRIDLSPDHMITVDERGFSPRSLEIEAGDVVLLVNEGSGLHSFTADERFDTGQMQPGDETTLVLSEPGTIPYRDLEDPDHEASITVVEAPDGS